MNISNQHSTGLNQTALFGFQIMKDSDTENQVLYESVKSFAI